MTCFVILQLIYSSMIIYPYVFFSEDDNLPYCSPQLNLDNRLGNIEYNFYPSGQLKSINEIKNKEYCGINIAWHCNGAISSVGTYKNGKLNGKYETFFENGLLSSTCFYDDSKKDRDEIKYWSNGFIMLLRTWENGKKIDEVFFNERGKEMKKNIHLNRNPEVQRPKIQFPKQYIGLIEELFDECHLGMGSYTFVSVLFESNGCISNINISWGRVNFIGLDLKLVDCIRDIEFIPAKKNKKPVDFQITFQITPGLLM